MELDAAAPRSEFHRQDTRDISGLASTCSSEIPLDISTS